MTTENDPVLIQSTSQLAEKYPDNTTRSFKTAFILFNSPIISEFGFLSDLFVGYKRQIIMTTENDPVFYHVH
jgi:hypothetical protein